MITTLSHPCWLSLARILFRTGLSISSLVFLQCSVGGNDIMSEDRFHGRVSFAISAKLVQCAPYPDDPPSAGSSDESGFDLGVAFAKGYVDAARFFAPPEHYTEKDVEFCLTAIYATPCERRGGSQIAALLTQELLFCNPRPATFWDHQHFGQGRLID